MGSRVNSLREQHERNRKRKRGEVDDDDHPEEDIEMGNGDDVGEWVDPVRWSIFIKYIGGINRTFR